MWDYIFLSINVMLLSSGVSAVPKMSTYLAAFFAVDGTGRVMRFIRGKSIMSDIEKNKLFVSEEENINKALKENDIILQNLSKKVINVLSSRYSEYPTLDINKVDKISLKQLQAILRSIKEIQQYDDEIVPQGLYQNPEIEELMKKYDKIEDNKETSKELGYHFFGGPTEG